MLHRKRPQQRLIHQAEDSRVGADSDGERGQRHNGEQRAFPESAQRIADVFEQSDHVEVPAIPRPLGFTEWKALLAAPLSESEHVGQASDLARTSQRLMLQRI